GAPSRTCWSVLQQEVEHGVGEQAEDEIIEREDRQPLGWDRAGAGRRQQRRRAARRGDQRRHEQRQRDDRHDQVARARADRERGDERADERERAVEQREDQDEARQRRPRTGPEQQQRERGDRHDLDEREEQEQRRGLREEQRGAVDRREHDAVEAALLLLGDEQAVDAEDRREQQRDGEDAGRELARERVPPEPEVEEDERRDAEQQHRRNRLGRAALEQQVLAQEGHRRAHVWRLPVAHRYSSSIAACSIRSAGALSATRPSRSPSA